MEAVAARVQAAQNMNMIGVNIKRVNRVIGMSLKSMNLEQSFSTMETFDKQCEELDTQLAVMEESMNMTVASEQPEDQVLNLMKEVADEAGLSLSDDLQVEPQKKVEQQVAEEVRFVLDICPASSCHCCGSGWPVFFLRSDILTWGCRVCFG